MTAVELLEYSRPAVAAGQWWRLVSGHLVHLDAAHATGNALAAAMLLLWWRPGWLAMLVRLAGLAILSGAALHWLAPQVQWYLGLSGLLHGCWLLAAMQQQHRVQLAMIAALFLKLAMECAGTGHNAIALPEGHLAGVLAASLWLAGERWLTGLERRSTGPDR